MFVKTLLLTAFAFAVIYPLSFWIPRSLSFQNRFRKFNIGLPNTVGGTVLIAVWIMDIPISLKVLVTVWKVLLFSISRYLWKREYTDPRLMTIPFVFGGYALFHLQAFFILPQWHMIFIGVFGGIAACIFYFYFMSRNK